MKEAFMLQEPRAASRPRSSHLSLLLRAQVALLHAVAERHVYGWEGFSHVFSDSTSSTCQATL